MNLDRSILKFLRKRSRQAGGNKKQQSLFNELLNISLKGLNIGVNPNPENNGEENLIRNLKKKIDKSNPVLVDVGANSGHYTIMLFENFKEKKPFIYSFEPSPSIFADLNDNLKDYPLKIINAALGKVNENSIIYRNKKRNTLSSLYKREIKNHHDIEEEQVTIQTLDKFCNENAIEYIDFLKLDVEGHELDVLNGAQNLLNKNNIHYIQFEFGGCNIDSRTFFKDFYFLLTEKHNYKIYRILKDGLEPINEYHAKLEIFTTTNYFAELIT